MADKTSYKVTAASAVVEFEDGSRSIYYQNDTLPEGVTEGHLKHLLDLEFIEDSSKSKK